MESPASPTARWRAWVAVRNHESSTTVHLLVRNAKQAPASQNLELQWHAAWRADRSLIVLRPRSFFAAPT